MQSLLELTDNLQYYKDMLSGLASRVASNEEDITDTFDIYDSHLEEIFSRMTIVEGIVLQVDEKIQRSFDSVVKVREVKGRELNRPSADSESKVLKKSLSSLLEGVDDAEETTAVPTDLPTSANNPSSSPVPLPDEIPSTNNSPASKRAKRLKSSLDVPSTSSEDRSSILEGIDATAIDRNINSMHISSNSSSSMSTSTGRKMKKKNKKLGTNFDSSIAMASFELKLHPIINKLIADNLDNLLYSDSGKPNNNEAFENMMAVRKRVSRKTVRDVTSGAFDEFEQPDSPGNNDGGVVKYGTRSEFQKLQKQISQLKADKCDKTEIEDFLFRTGGTTPGGKQFPINSEQQQTISDIEKRNQEIVREMIALRREHKEEIDELKKHFNDTLIEIINKAANSMENDNKDTFLNTRAYCLSCGRDGRVRQQPESNYQSYPQLSRVMSPEIYRGGFRSPLRSTLEGSFVLEGSSSGVLGSMRRPKSAGQHMLNSVLSLTAPLQPLKQIADAVLPTIPTTYISESDTPKIISDELDDLGSSALDREDSRLFIGESMEDSNKYHHPIIDEYVGSKVVQKPRRVLAHMDDTSVTMMPIRNLSGIKTVSHAMGRPEAEALRPIYRKGFPGKKSLRAEIAYAPERLMYDLSGDSSLVLKSLNSTMQPRPYSSNSSGKKVSTQSNTTKTTTPVVSTSNSTSNMMGNVSTENITSMGSSAVNAVGGGTASGVSVIAASHNTGAGSSIGVSIVLGGHHAHAVSNTESLPKIVK